jgi:hypothetical protein
MIRRFTMCQAPGSLVRRIPFGPVTGEPSSEIKLIAAQNLIGSSELPRALGRGFLLHGQYLHHREVM